MSRSPEEQQRLDAAYEAFDAASLRGERYEIAAARLHLVRVLVATGWDAPQEVREQVLRDEKALRRQAESDVNPLTELLRPPSHRQPPGRRSAE